MTNTIKQVFKFSLIAFIFLGIVMVMGQFIGLLIQSQDLIINSEKYLATIAFVLSAIAALSGFILYYFKEYRK